MKPLMLIPPAQAEALYDAHEEAAVSDRLAPLPWLDDDAVEDDARGKPPLIAPESQDRRRGLFQQAA